jgi:hypothetical protein
MKSPLVEAISQNRGLAIVAGAGIAERAAA